MLACVSSYRLYRDLLPPTRFFLDLALPILALMSEDIKAIVGRAKKATMELDTIWKDRGIRKELKMKLVKALIWPEGWTLKKDDERQLEAAEMWCYRRLLRISWTEIRTNKSILDELETKCELLAQIIKRKMTFFGHSCRNNKFNLVKTCILGMMLGKRRRAPVCNTSITSRSGQGHPWKKT